jgi:hypothetical protein
MAIEADGNPMACLIDLVSVPLNRVRVLVPNLRSAYQRYAEWLPPLWKAFFATPFYYPGVPAGHGFTDQDEFDWRRYQSEVSVEADESVFNEQIHRDTQSAGGSVIRIEVPGHDTNFPAYSILRTDVVATLLEQVIGLQYGLIAVNRGSTTVRLDSMKPIRPGESLILPEDDLVLAGKVARVG